MSDRIIFLDVDGVLNDHVTTPSGYCGVKPACRDALNRVVDRTGAKLVVSSAWRYLVLSGSMTLKGFENMLRTHGVRGEVIGTTAPDETEATPDGVRPGPNQRGRQVADWLAAHAPTAAYVVLDDMDLGITGRDHPFVQTDGAVGLTEADADRAIEILGASS